MFVAVAFEYFMNLEITTFISKVGGGIIQDVSHKELRIVGFGLPLWVFKVMLQNALGKNFEVTK